jgi:hypothetical protein
MARIYESADDAITWLEEKDNDSNYVMELLKRWGTELFTLGTVCITEYSNVQLGLNQLRKHSRTVLPTSLERNVTSIPKAILESHVDLTIVYASTKDSPFMLLYATRRKLSRCEGIPCILDV